MQDQRPISHLKEQYLPNTLSFRGWGGIKGIAAWMESLLLTPLVFYTDTDCAIYIK